MIPQIHSWIDLTHALTEKTPTWEGRCGFLQTAIVKYDECPGDCKFLVQRLEMLAGIGTHIDAPAHCIPGGKTVAEIPLAALISPCIVINVSEEAHALYSIEMPVVEQFEKAHGKICENAFVIFYTGWGSLWEEPAKYHNDFRFPCVAKEVATYLVSKNVAGIGIDTLSPDRPESGFAVHQIILGAGKYIVENIANAHLMPATGAWCLVLPMKTFQGTEAPVRLLGALPNHSLL